MTKVRKDAVLHSAVFLASALSILLSFRVLGPSRGFISVWPLTAVEVAFCVAGRRRGRHTLATQLFATSGILTAGAACRLPWAMTAVVVVLSQLEVFVAQKFLAEKVSKFEDLRRFSGMIRFWIVAVACPAGIAILAALPLGIILHRSLWTTGVSSAIADSLGYVTIFPLALLLFSGVARQLRDFRPRYSVVIPASALFLCVTTFAFWQTSDPILFLIFPPLIFVVFTLGLEGAVFASVALAVIGSIATKLDHGPLTLAQTAAKNHALFLLQIFLWIASATALPVGSLLGEQRRARRRATEAELVHGILLQNTEDMIILSSIDGSQRYISPSVTRVTGWTTEEFLAMDRYSTLHPDDRDLGKSIVESILAGAQHHSFRYRTICKDGSWRWVEAIVRGYKDASGTSVTGYVSTVRDVSERRKQEHEWDIERLEMEHANRQLAIAANTDKLTGVSNRRGLDEALQRVSLAPCAALLLLDVDHFKAFNDFYGHMRGDDCLRDLAKVLSQATDNLSRCTVARFGGEEFAIVLPDTGMELAYNLAHNILAEFNKRRFKHEASPRGYVTMSIGISVWDGADLLNADELISRADKALYESKRAGRNCVTRSEQHETMSA